MLGTRTLRDRSTSREPDGTREAHSKSIAKSKVKDKTPVDGWVEPSLAQKPSYRDHHGGSYYGVAEHMQPLGEAPNARVKTRVKPDGARKSVLGKSAAAAGFDAQETPEGTPAPPAALQAQVIASPPPQPQIVIEDEDDGDYAPVSKGKKVEKTTRSRKENRGKVSTDSGSGAFRYQDKKYYDYKIKGVVDEAVKRAIEAGKPDLAAAVHLIYIWSLDDKRITELLQVILDKSATPGETREFQSHVKRAKTQLKAERKVQVQKAKAKEEAARSLPNNVDSSQSLPLRSPSKFTSAPAETAAIPSTETIESSKPRISLKVKSPSNEPKRRRSGQSATMSASPSKGRSGSPNSDSSLTDLTSNPDDNMDMDEPEDNVSGSSAKPNTINGRDHAAERGSLAAQARNLKRSSADAELEDEERERVLASKKQKLNETVTRDSQYEESNVRGLTNGTAPRLRLLRGKNESLAPPSLKIPTNGGRTPSARGSRAVSSDLDSPLSEPLTQPSRQNTPYVSKGPTKPSLKRAKTKQSPEKKHLTGYSGMPGASGAGRESPIGEDDNEELSENNDFCSACGGSGFLLCCDGCDRSFHFSCLDPPLNEDASELNEPWYCYICVAKRPISTEQPEKSPRGLFASLFNSLKKCNPSNFALPQDLREYFEGVAADKIGSFVEAVNTKTRNRPGYDELPDYTRIKDAKGNTILCYSCGKSSQGTRPILPCDYCSEHWHLDCLDPPLANPPARTPEGKKLHDWMCPLHVDHELRKVDTSLLNPPNMARRVHIRKPRNAKVVDTSLRRGFRNNGVIDVIDDDSDDTDTEFYDEETPDESVVYRLPAEGIKLDFIDKIKSTRVQQLQNEHAFKKARIATQAPKPLEQANFARRPFREKQMALNLAQFAKDNKDLDLGDDQVENLVGTLIAEAPSEVVDSMLAAEDAEKARSASSAIPPSPPSSDQTDQLSAEQRQELQLLQELIRRKLDNGKT